MKSMPTSRSLIKVCGLTRAQDVDAAIEAGADALGFIFYPGSPRCLSRQLAIKLIDRVPQEVRTVGVFANAGESELEAALRAMRLNVLQLHGALPAKLPQDVVVWQALAADAGLQQRQRRPEACAVLLDAPSSHYGGTGRSFDWSLAAEFPAPVIIAGGLHAGNVGTAIATARAWGVDASSRLETAPGQKDGARVRAFVNAAREAFSRLSTTREAGQQAAPVPS